MDAKLQQIVDRFVSELREHVLAQVLESLRPPSGPASNSTRRFFEGVDAQRKTLRERKERRMQLDSRLPKGEKRTPDQLGRDTERLLELLQNAGSNRLRIEHIAIGLDLPTKRLVLPVKKLLAARKIRKAGVRRATVYWAA